ncbi:hypothetical protein F443_05345 [Phytophthora nicotianae P1569]|uniref:Uncharacterized protein n=1 Tax=Phytophthora nicotianae P1569 TaxID=1317065 RepID=V9FII9_PHYNI|nr:hypothetical protein F443_05345 [Phytophthora nicotianae P1569]
MNLPLSPKGAIGELPQFLLERSENDDDIGNSSPISGKLTTPNYVREAATSIASRWQWKYWKKSSPSSLTQLRHKQRKYPLPGKILAPLPASSSPGRHNVEKLDNLIDSIAEHHFLPSRPCSAETSAHICFESPLPPLEQQIVQRPRLVLDINGAPTIAMEQIVRLQEYIEPNSPVNALQLAVIPKKCSGGDEIALMPCHSLQHRGYELLSAELWREPVRNRNKHWLHDELPFLVRGTVSTIRWRMTKAPSANNRGKWTRFEAYKLHIPSHPTATTLDTRSSSVSPVKKPQRVLLRAQGILISRSYCVVSVFGEGIYGRLYGAGLTGKDKKRYLRVEAYNPATSRTYSLVVTLQDIEWIFRVGGDDPEREALLAPGRKQELLRQLITLLYFEYPDDPNNADDSGDAVKNHKIRIPVLKISPEIQLNESAVRRLEREERLRQDEARRLEELAALLEKPRRARHRLLCRTMKLRGRHFYVSIYHFPAQARNLIITAYNSNSSITYRLTIGLVEAASLVKLYPYPRGGFSPEQTMLVAQGLLSRLQLLGHERSKPNARMMLAINGGRKGSGMNALPLLAPMMTSELKRDELFNKMLQDSQRSLQLELEMTQLRLHNEAEAERVEIRQKITIIETKRAEINEKDQGQRIRIEEIDAAGGGGNVDAKRLHEERRALKTARQALKAEMKTAAAQLTELKQQLQAVGDKEKAAGERAQRRADRARKRIREDVAQTLAAILQPTIQSKRQLRVGQRTWLARIHMRPDRTFLGSGGCQISRKRLRYSLFALEPESSDDVDVVDANRQLFTLELYDPFTCCRCTSFVFSKLEWLALTKTHLEQQQLVPELAPAASDVVKRLAELQETMKDTRQACFTMKSSGASSKGKTLKTKAASSKKKREELQRAIAAASNEIHRIHREAPWPVLVKALCERCTITPATDTTTFDITLDRCIFRAESPVLRITNDENDGQEDEPSAVDCHVRAEVLPFAEAVVIEVWDPRDRQLWRLEYPESRELLHEFEIETFVEQQMHLEAITMSLMLYPNTETGRLELRFEE